MLGVIVVSEGWFWANEGKFAFILNVAGVGGSSSIAATLYAISVCSIE